MSQDEKNPIRGMFDAGGGNEVDDVEIPREADDVPEKNATEKMFETNLKKSGGDDVQEVPAKTPAPPKKNFKEGKLTAEERLLRVIDDNGDVPEDGKFAWLKLPRLEKVTDRTQDAIRRMKEAWSHRRLDLATINKGLLAAIGLIMFFSVVNAFAFNPDIKIVYDRVVKLESRGLGSNLTPYKPAEEYLSAVAKRSLFHPVTNDKVPAAGSPAVPAGGEDKILGDLQLVGIAWGEYPEAMIRDKSDGRTYFLKKDQQFKGIKVREVSKDKVIVEYGGKNRELM